MWRCLIRRHVGDEAEQISNEKGSNKTLLNIKTGFRCFIPCG
jgi:hypothetical protein